MLITRGNSSPSWPSSRASHSKLYMLQKVNHIRVNKLWPHAMSVARILPPPAAWPVDAARREVCSSACAASISAAATTSPTVTIWLGGMWDPSGTVMTRPELVRLCLRASLAERPAAQGSPRRAAMPVKARKANATPETTAAARPNQNERADQSQSRFTSRLLTYRDAHHAQSARRTRKRAQSAR